MHTTEIILNAKQIAIILRVINAGESNQLLISYDIKELLKQTDYKTRKYIEKVSFDWRTPPDLTKAYLHFIRSLTTVKLPGVNLLLGKFVPSYEQAQLVTDTFNEIMELPPKLLGIFALLHSSAH